MNRHWRVFSSEDYSSQMLLLLSAALSSAVTHHLTLSGSSLLFCITIHVELVASHSIPAKVTENPSCLIGSGCSTFLSSPPFFSRSDLVSQLGFNFQGEFQNCHLLTLVYFHWRMLTSQKRRRGGKNCPVCFIPMLSGSGQSYSGAVLLHSMSDTHSLSTEQRILLLSIEVVKNNKSYFKIFFL